MAADTKKVSIVVPCYNTDMYLDRCMEHLTGQTIGVEQLEIILVDDASTDDGLTWTKIMQWEQRFPDVVLAVQLEENLRQGGARNVGISYASGEYLMFCDADDWLVPEAAECLYQKAVEYDADVVEYRYVPVDTGSKQNGISTVEGNGSHFLLLEDEEDRINFYMELSDECSLGCMRKFYRMSMIQDNHIRFAEYLICEEPSFTLPVRFYEKRHYFLDRILYFYYMAPNSTIHGNWDYRKLDNLQVWKILVEDLRERGLLVKYHEEIEYMFYKWGYVLSIKMILKKGYSVTVEEISVLVEELLTLFPNIRENKYLKKEAYSLDLLLKTVLDMELTEESVRTMNEILRKYL